MKIVFDFDGVICYSQVEMLRRLSNKLGRLITVDDWKIYNMNKNFDAETVKALKPIFTEDVYNDAEVDAFDENIGECMKIAHERGHDVGIETICDSETTYNNKQKYIQGKGLGFADMQPVYSFDKQIKADIVVEDCYENLEKADANIKILITRPWNKNFNADITVDETVKIPHESLCIGSDNADTLVRKIHYIRVNDTQELKRLFEELL